MELGHTTLMKRETGFSFTKPMLFYRLFIIAYSNSVVPPVQLEQSHIHSLYSHDQNYWHPPVLSDSSLPLIHLLMGNIF